MPRRTVRWRRGAWSRPYGTVPLNVARICAWTYQYTHDDGHATPAGYQKIADTLLAALS
ncbi:hypothetical protein ACQP1W_28280 [Spirillospora sp. CA-255316]